MELNRSASTADSGAISERRVELAADGRFVFLGKSRSKLALPRFRGSDRAQPLAGSRDSTGRPRDFLSRYFDVSCAIAKRDLDVKYDNAIMRLIVRLCARRVFRYLIFYARVIT